METLIAVIMLVAVIGLAALPVWLVRRKKWKSVPKAERRAQTTTALIILAILFAFVFIRTTLLNNAKDDIIKDASTSHTTQSLPDLRQSIIDSVTSNGNGLTTTDGACIADVLIAHHGETKLRQLNASGTVDQIYTAEVKAKLRTQCDVVYD